MPTKTIRICARCGKPLTKKPSRQRVYCSHACRNARGLSPDGNARTCSKCGATKPLVDFPSNGSGLVRPICRECDNARRAAHYHANRAVEAAKQKKWREANKDYLAARNKEWRLAHPYSGTAKEREQGRISASRRRALQRRLVTERIEPRVVFSRDGGICGICLEPVDPNRFHIDHIVPLALGGPHVYSNVQLAHPLCNHRKGARLPPGVETPEGSRQLCLDLSA